MDQDEQNESQENPTGLSKVLDRYRKLREADKDGFFDIEDFGSIIDHFVDHFDLEEASLAIEQGLAQHPNSFEISLRKAHLALIKGDSEECLRILGVFELMQPNNDEIIMLKAEAYTHRDEVNKAIHLIEELLSRNSFFDKAKLYVQLAELYMQKSNYLESISCWKNAIESEPELEMAYVAIRLCFQTAEIVEEGVRYFHSITENRPYCLPAWAELGECYSQLSKYDAAIEAFDFALAIDENNHVALSGKGTAQFQSDDFHGALNTFKELKTLLPDDPSVICSLGECYEEMEDYTLAETHFLSALAIDPEHTEARLGYAISCEHLSDSKKAMQQMETVVGLEPDNPEYWFIYGELLSRNEELEKSQLAFERAIQLSSENIEYITSQIDALIKAGELDRALDKVQSQFEALGDIPEIYYRGIRVLFLCGKKEEGLVLLEMLVERHGHRDELRAYYPDIFEDSEALELLK